MNFYETLSAAKNGFTLAERRAECIRTTVFDPRPRSDVGLRIDYPAETEWGRRDQQKLYRILGAGGAAGVNETPISPAESE